MISSHAAFNFCTKFKAFAASVKIRNVQATKNASHLKMLFQSNLGNVTKRYEKHDKSILWVLDTLRTKGFSCLPRKYRDMDVTRVFVKFLCNVSRSFSHVPTTHTVTKATNFLFKNA